MIDVDDENDEDDEDDDDDDDDDLATAGRWGLCLFALSACRIFVVLKHQLHQGHQLRNRAATEVSLTAGSLTTGGTALSKLEIVGTIVTDQETGELQLKNSSGTHQLNNSYDLYLI